MSDKVSLVRVLTSATGNSTPITLGLAYSQLFMTTAEAGAVDGRTYTWLIVDGNNWELVKGVYTASGTTAARTTVIASRSGGTLGTSRITLSGTAQVRIVESAVDMDGVRGTRSVTGTSDALAATDLGYVVTYSNAASVAVSLAQAGTASLYDGWATWVQNLGVGTVTITPATSTINGATTLVLATNMGAFIWSDGANYHAYFVPVSKPLLAANNLAELSGTTAQQGLALKNIGAAQFSLINGKIVESHASGVVTFAIKTFAGTDPSSTDPASVIFSDGTQAFITAALSVNSLNSSGTFGTASGVACRLWICIFNDSGTLRLGIRNCVDPTTGSIYGFPGNGVGSTVGGNNAFGGTWANGTSVSAKQFVIVGFADYDSGVTTAGTWGVSPSRIQLFGPGIKRPGDLVQTMYSNTSTSVTVSNSTTPTQTALSVTITPTSPANVVKIGAFSSMYLTTAASSGTARISRGTGPTYIGTSGVLLNNSATTLGLLASMLAFDIAKTTSAITYYIYIALSAATTNTCGFPDGSNQGDIVAEEFMG